MTKIIFNKSHKIIAAVMALVLCFSAFLWIAPQVQAEELDISDTSVTGFTTPGVPTTIIDDNLSGGSIGVFVVSTTGDRYRADNVKWTYNNGEWELDGDSKVLFENNGEKQQIAAYYPYTETTNGSVAITLPEAYDANYDQYDYLYGEYHPLSSNPAIIRMEHLMAKVTVNVQDWGTELAGDVVESIALVDVPRTATWTLPGDTLAEFGDGELIDLYGNGSSYTGYALPNEAEDLTLRITMESGRIFTATVSLDDLTTSDETESLEGGVHYRIGVKLGKDKVDITTINVIPWMQMGINAGVAEEVCQHVNIANGICTNCGTKFFDYDEITNTAMISTAEGLLAWNKEARTDLTLNLTLAADITLAGENNWTPVGYFAEAKNYPYIGTIDGGGHTITGLHISGTACTQAFVGSLGEGGSIKDLTFANAQVTGANWSGVVTGINRGTIENCCVTSGSLTSTGGSSGVFAGYNTGKVNGCTNSATVALAIGSQESYMGGIVGFNISSGTIIGCINTGAVSGNGVGGIAGWNDRGTVVACGNTGSVTYTHNTAGGIVGFASGSYDSDTRIVGCWTGDTNEHNGTNEVTGDKNGIGNESEYLPIYMCFSGDVATINGKVSDMNTAIGDTYGYIWQTGTDGYPTLVATE